MIDDPKTKQTDQDQPITTSDEETTGTTGQAGGAASYGDVGMVEEEEDMDMDVDLEEEEEEVGDLGETETEEG